MAQRHEAAVRDEGRPSERRSPDFSIVVPVNAQGDLDNIRAVLSDLAGYEGPHAFETVLVVNNFPEGEPPVKLKELRRVADVVLAIPSVRRKGYAIPITARIHGVRAASTNWAVLFDADSRIPDPTTLLNWYYEQFRGGASAAYTPVGYYDRRDATWTTLWLVLHHSSRWVKRALFGVPTTRGSNYAVRRDVMLELFEEGVLADDLNVGPAVKKLKGPINYARGKGLTVLTSGRALPKPRRLPRYFLLRLRYNLRVLPVRADVAELTGREKEPLRRYRDNEVIKD